MHSMRKLVLALTAVLMVTGMAAASTGLDDCSGDFCAMDSGDTQENDSKESPDTSNPDPKPDSEGLFDGLFSFIGGLFN